MCHHRHHARAGRTNEPARAVDPLESDPDLRASDAERERVVALLRDHGAAGRLDVDELETRVEAAYRARTRAELTPLLEDLPAADAPRREREPVGGNGRLMAFALLAGLLVAIWALTGAGWFWPAWPLGFMAFGMLKHGRAWAARPLRVDIRR